MGFLTVGVVPLDALVVGAPALDGGLDGFGFEVLSDGAAGESGKLGVGREAECDELAGGEGVQFDEFRGRAERREAEALFEPDDAVLVTERVEPELGGEQQQGGRHDDHPGVVQRVVGAVLPCPDRGDDHVDEEDGDEDVMGQWIKLGVVLKALFLRHESDYSWGVGPGRKPSWVVAGNGGLKATATP